MFIYDLSIHYNLNYMGQKTIIAVERETVTKLKELKIAKRESYDEIINRLINLFKNQKNG